MTSFRRALTTSPTIRSTIGVMIASILSVVIASAMAQFYQADIKQSKNYELALRSLWNNEGLDSNQGLTIFAEHMDFEANEIEPLDKPAWREC